MTGTEGLVETAVYAIEHFAGRDATRETAAKVFPLWHRYEFLARATREAVLEHFPVVEPEPVAGFDFHADPDGDPDLELGDAVEPMVPMPRMMCGTWPRSVRPVA